MKGEKVELNARNVCVSKIYQLSITSYAWPLEFKPCTDTVEQNLKPISNAH